MRFCGMCGRPLGGANKRERRRVSVLFVDLAGFTTLTHNLDPEQRRDLADEVLSSVANVVWEHGGSVDSFRGDGLIAVFGAPNAHANDPYRATLAAEAGLRAIEQVGHARNVTLRGRAGVTTGVVIAGEIGFGRVREYTVMGSVVNLASRLEQAAAPGTLLVDEETFRSAHHRLHFTSIDGTTLPGFPEVTRLYRLVSPATRDPDAYAHLNFIGRARELGELQRWHEWVRQHQLPLFGWVLGEEGRGKTRLLREFAQRLTEAADVRRRWPPVIWLRGGLLWAHSVWAALAQQLFNLREGDAGAPTVAEAIAALLPGEEGAQELIRTTLAEGRMPSPPHPEQRGLNPALVAWRDLLCAVARAQREGLTVIIDSDRHDPIMDQFDGLLARAEAPLLVLRSARGTNPPDRRGPSPNARPPTTVALVVELMTRKEAVALLEQVAEPELRRIGEALLAQVGGSPSAVVELALALSATRISDFQDSLTGLLQARIDLLPPGARRLLPLAAAGGERCWEGLLQATFGEVRGDLEILISQDLLTVNERSLIPGERELRFRSSLLQRTVMAMTPHAERPTLHLRVARWLEDRAPLHLSGLIAWQFERGDAPESAYPHYITAAMEAEGHGDSSRCDSMFERIAALQLPLNLQAQAVLVHGDVACERGDLALAEMLLARARGLLAGSSAGEENAQRTHADALRATLKHRRALAG
jgi:class 3 adenylate cyclase